MAQCTDTHLFCTSCVTSYVSTQLGEQNSSLRCMDLSGCKMTFPDSELRRILPEKLFGLYEHIRQRREIDLAGLEGLEECPFCDFKVVIDVDFEVDKVLRCQNEECGKVSCRKCKEEVSSIMHTTLALHFESADSWRLGSPSENL
jgi:TRIAD3 protein (E3 ubiquitin-protein ligase RNF216)